MPPRAETSSVVFGQDRVAAVLVCARHGSGVFRESAWRTGSPCLRRSARQRAYGFLRARCRRFAKRPSTFVKDRVVAYSTRIRPTDFCHPTYLSTCTRARGSRPASRILGFLRPVVRDGSRDTTFHDVVARFHRTRGVGARLFAEAARMDRASDTPVARSCRRAVLSDDCVFTFEPRPP